MMLHDSQNMMVSSEMKMISSGCLMMFRDGHGQYEYQWLQYELQWTILEIVKSHLRVG